MQPTTKPSRSDLTYTAGLIDGEGSVMISHTRGRHYPRVTVSSTSVELIDYLSETFGGCVSSVKREARRREFTWCMNGRKAIAFLRRVLPYLREAKKSARAEFLISEYPWGDDPTLRERFYEVQP